MTERILPREFATPPEFLVPLSNPELLELGTFTAIWAQIDWLIMMMIGKITKTEIPQLLLLTETMTTGPRVGLLGKLCQQDPTETHTAIKKLLDDNGGLIEDRNHLMHGLWMIKWDSDGSTAAANLYSKNKRKPILASKLVTLTDRASTLSNALCALLERLAPEMAGDFVRPRRFFFGEGPPDQKSAPTWPPS